MFFFTIICNPSLVYILLQETFEVIKVMKNTIFPEHPVPTYIYRIMKKTYWRGGDASLPDYCNILKKIFSPICKICNMDFHQKNKKIMMARI